MFFLLFENSFFNVMILDQSINVLFHFWFWALQYKQGYICLHVVCLHTCHGACACMCLKLRPYVSSLRIWVAYVSCKCWSHMLDLWTLVFFFFCSKFWCMPKISMCLFNHITGLTHLSCVFICRPGLYLSMVLQYLPLMGSGMYLITLEYKRMESKHEYFGIACGRNL